MPRLRAPDDDRGRELVEHDDQSLRRLEVEVPKLETERVGVARVLEEGRGATLAQVVQHLDARADVVVPTARPTPETALTPASSPRTPSRSLSVNPMHPAPALRLSPRKHAHGVPTSGDLGHPVPYPA